jgi:predicted DNA-binding transcriptional regulator YafY
MRLVLPKSPRLIIRLGALLEVLGAGPLSLAELIARLGAAYPPGDSARRMLDRDCRYLAALGITVERSTGPVYTLRGGIPCYRLDELRTLALIRDSFDANHPQAEPIGTLLKRLTANLDEQARRDYAARTLRRAPLRPAIDYSPYAESIECLERAITVGQPVGFHYQPIGRAERQHPFVEPYAIEFYDRHFYLVGYSTLSRRINDFRIDRIRALTPHEQRRPASVTRERPLITFRYRLAADLAQGELSQRFETQRVIERLANGDLIIEAQGRSDFFIIQTLLRYRANAELLWPPELRARMVAEVQALAEVYAASDE